MTDLELIQFVSLKMFYAVICGAIVGFERRMNFSPAGFKTQILVCVGAMLFTISPHIGGLGMVNETPRVIGQIVTGIGFLGAGTIIHNTSRTVSGLTTAAWIWFTAAIGVMIGLNHGAVALFITVTLGAVISLFRVIEKKFFSSRACHIKNQHSSNNSEDNHTDIRKAG